MLPHTEFTYNYMVDRYIGKNPFEIIYGRISPYYLDFATIVMTLRGGRISAIVILTVFKVRSIIPYWKYI